MVRDRATAAGARQAAAYLLCREFDLSSCVGFCVVCANSEFSRIDRQAEGKYPGKNIMAVIIGIQRLSEAHRVNEIRRDFTQPESLHLGLEPDALAFLAVVRLGEARYALDLWKYITRAHQD
jgi:hypothetical protein